MAINAQSIPMRWTAGPLDIARRQKEKEFTPEQAEVLRKWQDPALLALVQGTPINCLVISWASGLAADAEQQQALRPLIEKGRQAGLDVVGLVEGSADKTAAIVAARAAGLSAVAMETIPPGNAGIPVIAWGKSGDTLWGANSPVLGVSDGFWPGVPQERAPTGGPTNLPWVDSNGALLAMGRALAPNKPLWIVADPPQGATLAIETSPAQGGPAPGRGGSPQGGPPQAVRLTVENYLLAVADVEAYGGRWLVSLDDRFCSGLASKTAAAVDAWRKVTDALAFFEQNKANRTYERVGRLAVLSSFSGADRFMSEEALNLLPRLREPFRVIPRSQALAASFSGLQGIFYADEAPPEAKLRQKLVAFANAGGTLFVRSKWPNAEGKPTALPAAEAYLLFSIRSLGKGRLAVAREDQPDAYFTCQDIQNILSHRGDPARLYNASSANYFYQAAPQGKQGVVHVLNYSRRPGSDGALVFLKTPYKVARFVSPEVASPAPLQWSPQAAGGAELSLPRFAVYGAVQMEG